MAEHALKEDKFSSVPPQWINESGVRGGLVYTVGVAEASANSLENTVKRMAILNGETSLMSKAPADFRIATQNSMNSVNVDENVFTEIQSKIQEVLGVEGFKHDKAKTACRKVLRYGETEAHLNRICWVRIAIPVNKMARAFERTMAMKFGEKVSEAFKKKLDDELKKADAFSLENQSKRQSEPKQAAVN